MRVVALSLSLLLGACHLKPQPETPTGENLAKTAAETSRRQLAAESPVIYSSSSTAESDAGVETPPEPQAQPEPKPEPAPELNESP